MRVERVDTQQYYEVIGKYDQFVYGWDDTKDLTLDTNNDQVQSTLRLDYEDQRNESNKLLKRASVVVGLGGSQPYRKRHPRLFPSRPLPVSSR